MEITSKIFTPRIHIRGIRDADDPPPPPLFSETWPESWWWELREVGHAVHFSGICNAQIPLGNRTNKAENIKKNWPAAAIGKVK